MTILKGDIRLFQSERMFNNPNGGGNETSIEIISGVSNNVFDDISPLDRINGALNIRKVFERVTTSNNDKLHDSFSLVTKNPRDKKIQLAIYKHGTSNTEYFKQQVFDEITEKDPNPPNGYLNAASGDFQSSNTTTIIDVNQESEIRVWQPEIQDNLYDIFNHREAPLLGLVIKSVPIKYTIGTDASGDPIYAEKESTVHRATSGFLTHDNGSGAVDLTKLTSWRIVPDSVGYNVSMFKIGETYSFNNVANTATITGATVNQSTITVTYPTGTVDYTLISEELTLSSNSNNLNVLLGDAFTDYATTLNLALTFPTLPAGESYITTANGIPIQYDDATSTSFIREAKGVKWRSVVGSSTASVFNSLMQPRPSKKLFGMSEVISNIVVTTDTFMVSNTDFLFKFKDDDGTQLLMPKFRQSDTVVIFHDISQDITPASNSTTNLGRTNLARVFMVDTNDVEIDHNLYTVDLVAGTVSWLDLTPVAMPITVTDTIETLKNIASISQNGENFDIVIQGQVSKAFPSGTMISSIIQHGDLQARVNIMFTQQSWTSVWQDSPIGNDIIAGINPTLSPIEVVNRDSITERWLFRFLNSNTVSITGEKSGQILASADILSDIAPINPITGFPYFTIHPNFWGTGWSTGNVFRMDTQGASTELWLLESTDIGDPTDNTPGSFTGCFANRGYVNG